MFAPSRFSFFQTTVIEDPEPELDGPPLPASAA
jgi:hypothetical protein